MLRDRLSKYNVNINSNEYSVPQIFNFSFLKMKGKDFVKEIVDFYNTTNYLHPFREGNGRTQRIFISKLIKFNGYNFNFSSIDSDLLMIATIKAANGIADNLYDIFNNEIK